VKNVELWDNLGRCMSFSAGNNVKNAGASKGMTKLIPECDVALVGMPKAKY